MGIKIELTQEEYKNVVFACQQRYNGLLNTLNKERRKRFSPRWLLIAYESQLKDATDALQGVGALHSGTEA